MSTCPNCARRLSRYTEHWVAETVETTACEHCGWEVSYTVHPDRSTPQDHAAADDGSTTTAEDLDASRD
jgi:Zn ribbon nucleic-acid-binding protein